jgi:hypothetical protein
MAEDARVTPQDPDRQFGVGKLGLQARREVLRPGPDDQASEEGTLFQLSKQSVDDYEEEEPNIDSLGKAFFYGPKVDLAASGLLAKRFTMKGIRERVSIVDNQVILTFVKEGSKNSPSLKEIEKSRERELRPKVSTFNAKKATTEIDPKDNQTQNSGPIRFHKSRESAINHMVFYLNQGKTEEKIGSSPTYKKIDLNKYKPQLISSEEKLTFGVNTSPVKDAVSPDFFRENPRRVSSMEESRIITRHISHINPFEGSMLDEIKSSPKKTSEQSPIDQKLSPDEINDLEVDIVEIKNIDQAQIREIVSLTIEERSLLNRRMNHLTKRLQVLERIIRGDDEEIKNKSQKHGDKLSKKSGLTKDHFEEESSKWMLNTLMNSCQSVKTCTLQLLDTKQVANGRY